MHDPILAQQASVLMAEAWKAVEAKNAEIGVARGNLERLTIEHRTLMQSYQEKKLQHERAVTGKQAS